MSLGGTSKAGIFAGRSRRELIETEISWVFGLVLLLSVLDMSLQFQVVWLFFGVASVILYALPVVRFRDVFKVPPWEIVLLLIIPDLLHLSQGSDTLNDLTPLWRSITAVADSLGMATVGFLMMAELEMYTSLKSNRYFAALFVALFTMAASGWALTIVFLADQIHYSTLVQSNFAPSIGDNTDVMMFFIYTLIVGIAMGLIYSAYVKLMSPGRKTHHGFEKALSEALSGFKKPAFPPAQQQEVSPPMRFEGQRKSLVYVTWAMQLTMVGIGVLGVVTKYYTWVPAAALSFLITLLPAAFSRTLKVAFPLWLTFWIVLALFLHTVGGYAGFYNNLPGWDHVTHLASASLIAALGFVVVVAVDVYVDSIYLPRPFVAFFVLMFTMAIGVLWEIMEFAQDQLVHTHLQYGLDDTMYDLLTDGLAGLFVAVFVFSYLKNASPEQFVKSMGFDAAKSNLGRLMGWVGRARAGNQ